MWASCNWLNKFYNFHIAAVAGNVSRHDLKIEGRYRNQPSSKIEIMLSGDIYSYHEINFVN